MKKLIIAAIAVLSVGVASAQNVKFGIKAGLNYATFSGDVKESNGIIGFAAGGFANIAINEKFAFQPELLFSIQGTTDKSTNSYSGYSYTNDYTSRVNYLNVPLMFRFKAAEKFYLEGGPQVGFLLSVKRTDKVTRVVGNTTTVTEYSSDNKDDVNTVDFGLNFGAGYDFTKNISVGLRYNLGLSNVAKDVVDYKVRNSVFSLAVGYTF